MYEEITGSQRIAWAGLPPHVAGAVERALGSPVAAAVSQPGGFSDGLAARVRLADGRRAFVKAAKGEAVAVFHRREALVAEALSPTGLVPRLLHVYDDGAWVALVFEEVDGHLPAQPWRLPVLERTLRALTGLADALTPSPVPPDLLAPPRLGGWREVPGAPDRDRLVALEDRAGEVLAGDTLLHGDLYPFNLLLTPDRVVAVDWPHAWIGAPWCDVLTLMSSASLSGIDPQSLADRHPLTRDLDPLCVDVFLAAHAGFLLRVAGHAGPATDPRLVAMMTRLGTASLTWLRRRW